jgi:hypothetical protein
MSDHNKSDQKGPLADYGYLGPADKDGGGEIVFGIFPVGHSDLDKSPPLALLTHRFRPPQFSNQNPGEPRNWTDGPFYADSRPVSVGDTLRMLIAGLGVTHGKGAGPDPLFQSVERQTREGRLFVVETLPRAIVAARRADAMDALRSGALKPPFPTTVMLMTLEGRPGARLLVASVPPVDGPRSYLDFSFATPCQRADGTFVWETNMVGGVPADTSSLKLPGQDLAPVFEPLQDMLCDPALVILSLIADSRVPVVPVRPDEKLNRARIKRGKAPILAYWKIEPTILIPNAAPTVAAKPKGGAHASPRPHDRRGHPRHLKKGDRTVWVRACKINALLPHLTRTREFYEVRLP